MQSDTHDKTRQCREIEHTGYSLIQHKMVDSFTEKVRNQSIFFPGFFYSDIFFLKCIDNLRTANILYRFIKSLAYIGKFCTSLFTSSAILCKCKRQYYLYVMRQ